MAKIDTTTFVHKGKNITRLDFAESAEHVLIHDIDVERVPAGDVNKTIKNLETLGYACTADVSELVQKIICIPTNRLH